MFSFFFLFLRTEKNILDNMSGTGPLVFLWCLGFGSPLSSSKARCMKVEELPPLVLSLVFV